MVRSGRRAHAPSACCVPPATFPRRPPMPKLACRTCGRQVYTAAPLESLGRDDRRCPRCGASLASERRLEDRRVSARRGNPPTQPPPPPALGEPPDAGPPTRGPPPPGDR